jgi:hypothetical protein
MHVELALLVTSMSDSTKRDTFARQIARSSAKLELTLETRRGGRLQVFGYGSRFQAG